MRKSNLSWLVVFSLVAVLLVAAPVMAANSGVTPEDYEWWVPVEDVTLNYHELYLDKGDKVQLIETVYPRDADDQGVTWSTSDSSIASVSKNGLVTAKGSGYAIIAVTTDDGGYFDYCEVTVGGGGTRVTGVSLNVNSGILDVGDTLSLKATVSPSNADNKDVYWYSDNEKVASVSSTGKVTARAEGYATITVMTDDGGYTDECYLYVEGGAYVTGISLNRSSLNLSLYDSYTLIATVKPSNASDSTVYWDSSNVNVVSVYDGYLYVNGTGTATITATTRDGGYKATCKVTVNKGSTSVTGVSISSSSISLNVNSTKTLSATVRPSGASNKDVRWYSSNTKVATVNANGKVTGIKSGTATITVETEDGGYTDTCVVKVGNNTSVTGVKLDKTSLSLDVDSSYHLTETVSPSGASNKDVSWYSNNSSVASVNNTGKVTAKKAGTATITVKTDDGGYTATCKVNVTKANAVTGVTLNHTSNTLYVGDSLKLVATVKPTYATNKDVSWSSSNSAIVTVNSEGKVTAKKAGTATITVTTDDGKYKATCKITVNSPTQVTGVTLNNSSMDLTIGETYNLTATVRPTGAVNDNVEWSSSNTNIAEVNTHGRVTAKKAGSCNIVVTTDEGGYTAVCHIYVSEGKTVYVTGVNLNQVQMNLEIGQFATLEALVTPSNASITAVDWTSSDSGIVSVAPNGKITAQAAGTATITACTVDGDYTASCKVTVGGSQQNDLFSAASSWAIDQLYVANDYGLIPEAMKGTDFTQPITRAEFAAIGVLLYEASSGSSAAISTNVFSDIEGNTYQEAILKAYQTGIVSGTGNGLFSPTAGLNRESAATMMTNVCRSIYGDIIEPEKNQLFDDNEQISQWARKPVYFMSGFEIIKGVGNNHFDPLGATTREQAIIIAKLVYELL